MNVESPFATARHYRPRATGSDHAASGPDDFGDPVAECRAARKGAALFDRTDRGLVVVTGADRRSWLHNLVTNLVKTLDNGAGAYAFAVDVAGRVQFDLNILAGTDELLLDIDRAALPAALEHFERRLITEDVALADVSPAHARLGCSGPHAAEIAATLGVGNLGALADLQHVRLADGVAWLLRHDFAGALGFELSVPRAAASDRWDRLVDAGAVPAGRAVLDVLRIDAGIPWLGRDLDTEATPLETGQAERGVSFNKGCYLGQEVIERMRSRGVLPRRLARLTVAGAIEADLPAVIESGGAKVGRLTSQARDPESGQWLALGYLKTTIVANAPLTCAGVGVQVRE